MDLGHDLTLNVREVDDIKREVNNMLVRTKARFKSYCYHCFMEVFANSIRPNQFTLALTNA